MRSLQGADEVERRRKRLAAVLALIKSEKLSPEANAHFARYLCILIAGFVEQSVKAIVKEYVKTRSSEQVQRHVQYQLRNLRNIDTEKLKQIVESFDPSWWDILERDCPDELDALISVTAVRNNASHGGDSGATLPSAESYFAQCDRLMRRLIALFDIK